MGSEAVTGHPLDAIAALKGRYPFSTERYQRCLYCGGPSSAGGFENGWDSAITAVLQVYAKLTESPECPSDSQ